MSFVGPGVARFFAYHEGKSPYILFRLRPLGSQADINTANQDGYPIYVGVLDTLSPITQETPQTRWYKFDPKTHAETAMNTVGAGGLLRSMSPSKVLRTFAVAAGLAAEPLIAQASPADLVRPTYHACAPAPQLTRIAENIVAPNGTREVFSLRALSGVSVSIKGTGGQYQVQAGSSAPATISAPVDALACQAVAPEAIRLLNGGEIAGQDLAAVDAVMAYRQDHNWPYGPAHPEEPRTQIDVQNRNGRVIVSIIDFKTLYSSNSLNCSGEEYYRVDLRTFDVKPFDGCAEGAPRTRSLPSLKDLTN